MNVSGHYLHLDFIYELAIIGVDTKDSGHDRRLNYT
jgi:hypothetical protein